MEYRPARFPAPVFGYLRQSFIRCPVPPKVCGDLSARNVYRTDFGTVSSTLADRSMDAFDFLTAGRAGT